MTKCLTPEKAAALQGISLNQTARLAMFISSEHYSHIERLRDFVERGEVTPAVGRRYALEEVPAAMDDLEAGRSAGKSVIVVRDSEDGHVK